MMFRRMVCAALAALALIGCGSPELPKDSALLEEWDYRRIETPEEPTAPPTAAEWDAARGDRGDHWFRNRIPSDAARPGLAVFRAYASRFDIFVDGGRSYSFRGPQQNGGIRYHVVVLPRHATGSEIFLRIPAELSPPWFGGSPILTTPDEVPDAIRYLVIDPMRSSAGGAIFGVLIVAFGFLCVAAWFLRRNQEGSRVFAALSLFAIFYGVRDLAGSHFVYLFVDDASFPFYVVGAVTYLINIAVGLVAIALLGRGWRQSLLVVTWLFAAFGCIGLISDLVTGTPMSLSGPNSVLVILGGLVFAANLAHSRALRERELRPVVFGLVVFGLFALNQNLVGLGLLPWPPGNESIGFLILLGSIAFVGTKRIVNAEKRLVEIESELSTARKIQSSILPDRMPVANRLKMAARYVPMTAVAGDLYDFHEREGGKLGLIVADVSGHGVPAALIASMVKVLAAAESKRDIDPARILSAINEALRGSVGRQFVTATYLSFDEQSGRVEVANGGHPPPLLIRGSTGEWSELGGSGTLLGRFKDAGFSARTTKLQPGDRIIVYTDGIVEAMNPRFEPFGEDRLREVIETNREKGGWQLADAIVARVENWSSATAGDDLTLVIVDFQG